MSLNGQWQFRQCGEQDWLPAQVPGCNFSDLYANGLINDPFYRDEEHNLQWVEHKDWEYKHIFTVDSVSLLHCELALVFEGLDTYCDVYLNGIHILASQNMFVGHRILCKQWVRAGDNELLIQFRSPINETMPQYLSNGFAYPAENDKSQERLSVFTRKAPYHFGWDWGPRFVTSGIWRNVSLEYVDKTRIVDVHVRQRSVSAAQAELSFDVTLDSLFPVDGVIELSCDNVDGIELVSCPVTINGKGESVHSVNVVVNQPKLWWPNGLGEPYLHQFHIRFVDKFGAVEQRILPVGIRTIEVINEQDKHGESFYLKVNGEPTFMKGANYIPSDSFLSRVSDEKYQRIFTDAVDANMNMLRVWGGGIYESDEFYRLADEHGILIWQDFMFACSLYPADEAFIDNVRQEVAYNVKRLRNHASLALWCGNNETEMGIEFWQWPTTFNYSNELYDRLKKEYNLLFNDVLPELTAYYDPDRFYFSSSPIGFWENREDDNRGDNHYWGVWHGEEPFEQYKHRVPRFMSEYGFQSFPMLSSVKRYSEPEDWHLDSSVMKTHQKHPRGNGLIAQYMRDEFPVAKDFESFLYLSQVQQALGLKIAFEAHRSAMPFCMGSLYWQFNDCWPVASWSSIDYYGHWKALHYQAKRSFTPMSVFVEQQDAQLKIRLVSDKRESTECQLQLRLCTLTGEDVWQQTSDLVVAANSSNEYTTVNWQEICAGYEISELVFVARLYSCQQSQSTSSMLLHEDFHYFIPTKVQQLSKPAFGVSCDYKDDVVLVTLVSDCVARQVHLSFNEVITTEQSLAANFSDNFFDMLPKESKTVRIRMEGLSAQQQASLLSHLQVRSLVDSFECTRVEE